MSNIHNPVRQADETQEAYKIRRKASNEASKANSQIGQGGRTTRNIVRDQIREKGRMKYVAGSYGLGKVMMSNKKEVYLTPEDFNTLVDTYSGNKDFNTYTVAARPILKARETQIPPRRFEDNENIYIEVKE